MKTKFIPAPLAKKDLKELAGYLKEKNSNVARELLFSFEKAVNMLAESLLMRHLKKDIKHAALRFWTFKWYYLAAYNPSSPIEIFRVLDGRQNVPHITQDII